MYHSFSPDLEVSLAARNNVESQSFSNPPRLQTKPDGSNSLPTAARSIESPKALNIARPVQVQNRVISDVHITKQASASFSFWSNLMQLEPPLLFSLLFQDLIYGIRIAQPPPMSVNILKQMLDTRTVKRFKGHKIECLSFACLERRYTPWA